MRRLHDRCDVGRRRMSRTARACREFVPPMPRLPLNPIQGLFSAGMAGIRRAFSTLCPPSGNPMLARVSSRFRPPRRAWRAFFFFLKERKEQEERGRKRRRKRRELCEQCPPCPPRLESQTPPEPCGPRWMRLSGGHMPAVCPPYARHARRSCGRRRPRQPFPLAPHGVFDVGTHPIPLHRNNLRRGALQ